VSSSPKELKLCLVSGNGRGCIVIDIRNIAPLYRRLYFSNVCSLFLHCIYIRYFIASLQIGAHEQETAFQNIILLLTVLNSLHSVLIKLSMKHEAPMSPYCELCKDTEVHLME